MKLTHLLKTTYGKEYWVWRNFGDDYYTHENGKVYVGGIHSLTPIIESNPPQEETFDWKTAMKLFADGVEVEAFVGSSWMSFPYSLHPDLIGFDKTMKYRRKRVAPKPDYSKNMGFKKGDIVMVSDDLEGWYIKEYLVHSIDVEYNHKVVGSGWYYARPLTKEEYSRVKVEQP